MTKYTELNPQLTWLEKDVVAMIDTDQEHAKAEIIRTVAVIRGQEKSVNALENEDIKINESNLAFGSLLMRDRTDYVILHHAAGSNFTVGMIHGMHRKKGWAGIGYHFYVRKDGSIWRGRLETTVGAHCKNYNAISIGVCFEGNFEAETMTIGQLSAGEKLIRHLKKCWPNADVRAHRDFNATACPGKNFPMETLKNAMR